MTHRISLYDNGGIESLRRELGIDPHLVHRVRTVFFKKFRGRDAAIAELPGGVRDVFAERVECHPLTLDARLDSEQDGATKLVFATASGKRIESVLLRAGTGRTALCISSQVGCAANCDFCATGKMGFHSNLTAAEMLDQVVQANEQIAGENRTVRNIVLMGMGEPFHNEPELYEALDTLVDGRGFNHPAKPNSDIHSWHSRRDAPLRPPLPGGQSSAQFALGAGRCPCVDHSARPQVSYRRTPRCARSAQLSAAIDGDD